MFAYGQKKMYVFPQVLQGKRISIHPELPSNMHKGIDVNSTIPLAYSIISLKTCESRRLLPPRQDSGADLSWVNFARTASRFSIIIRVGLLGNSRGVEFSISDDQRSENLSSVGRERPSMTILKSIRGTTERPHGQGELNITSAGDLDSMTVTSEKAASLDSGTLVPITQIGPRKRMSPYTRSDQ